MSQIEVERFLGRIITDAEFRERASISIDIACRCEGIAISAEELSLLSHLDFTVFGTVSETIDDSIRRT